MTDESRGSDAEHTFSDVELAAIGARMSELRRLAAGDAILRWSLAAALVVGLIAHVAGYLTKAGNLPEPLALIGELLYALGFALWTGAVVTFFVQVLPEGKRRQLKHALDAYEALPSRRRSELSHVFDRYDAALREKREGTTSDEDSRE